MGSSYYGELGLGGGKSTSRKGRKNSSSDKQKQPQRGLGVAQLEKIRLNTQFAHHEQQPLYIPPFNHHHHPPPPPTFKEEDLRVQMAFSSSPPTISSSSYIATSSSLFPLHPNTSMSVFGAVDHRIDPYIRNGEFQSSNTMARPYSNHQHSNSFLPQYVQQMKTLPLLEQNMEDSVQKRRRHDRSNSTGSMSQNSDSSDTQEVGLELKLSL